jgi:hypothetical protein
MGKYGRFIRSLSLRMTSVSKRRFGFKVPYFRVESRTFLTRIYPTKFGCGLYTEYHVLFTTEPATPVLYVVKLQVETASV